MTMRVKCEAADIVIFSEKCDGCGLCEDFCPVGVLQLEGGVPRVVKPGACYACFTCADLCPQEAIHVIQR